MADYHKFDPAPDSFVRISNLLLFAQDNNFLTEPGAGSRNSDNSFRKKQEINRNG